MTCEHLIELEKALLNAGARETSRGRAWSKNSREWVYFDCVLSNESIRQQFKLADCVRTTTTSESSTVRKVASCVLRIWTRSWVSIRE